jgi:Domain of unknown function (DUF4190)
MGGPAHPGSPDHASSQGHAGSPGSPSYPDHVGSPGYAGSPDHASSQGHAGSPGYSGSRGSPSYPRHAGTPGYAGSPGYAGYPGGQQAAPSDSANGFAIASFILALIGPLAILSVIFGIAALVRIRNRPQRGKGLAITGLVLMRVSESPSGRLGAWWPPAGEHFCFLGHEPCRKIVPLPAGRES